MAKLFDDDELYFEEYKKNVQKECTDQAGYVRERQRRENKRRSRERSSPCTSGLRESGKVCRLWHTVSVCSLPCCSITWKNF